LYDVKEHGINLHVTCQKLTVNNFLHQTLDCTTATNIICRSGTPQ